MDEQEILWRARLILERKKVHEAQLLSHTRITIGLGDSPYKLDLPYLDDDWDDASDSPEAQIHHIAAKVLMPRIEEALQAFFNALDHAVKGPLPK